MKSNQPTTPAKQPSAPSPSGIPITTQQQPAEAAACCSPTAQASCCAPSEKTACCGASGTSCGCK
jgi:hypothetical protein